jgi:hypothetical protein
MGFEVIDLFALFLTISVLNFIFGSTDFKIVLVWAPSLILACLLFFGKRGKPDNYLLHWLRYQFLPAIYSAFHEPSEWKAPPSVNDSSKKEVWIKDLI